MTKPVSNIISSIDNSLIKSVVKLHQSKYRDQEKRFIAEGMRVITSLAASKMELIQLFVLRELVKEAPAALVNAAQKAYIVTDNVMKKISQSETPSGFLAVFRQPNYILPSHITDAGLVLAQINDPGNMGTLIRTAAALALPDVFIVEGCDVWNHKVIQASAGTLGMVNIHEITWQELVQKVPAQQLCALVLHNGTPIQKAEIQNKLLVVGNEAHGLPEEWIARCGHQVILPMPGKAESLNAAVAGSIALYCAYLKK